MSDFSARPTAEDDWDRPLTLEEEEEDRRITAAAESDPDNPPLTDEQLANMVPYHTIFGRPKKENPKRLVSIRFSPEVIAHFRATGPGWQTRIDEALKAHIHNEKRESPLP
jgi:uncharacterized protein (DUF4415 family)